MRNFFDRSTWAWEDLGRVESGSKHGVAEKDRRLWFWQGSLDSISIKIFSWFSIGSTLEVTTSFLMTLIDVSSLESACVVRLYLF